MTFDVKENFLQNVRTHKANILMKFFKFYSFLNVLEIA